MIHTLIVTALGVIASDMGIQDIFCTSDTPGLAVEWIPAPEKTEAVAISCACNCTGPENTLALIEISASGRPKVLAWAEELRSFRLNRTIGGLLPGFVLFADKDETPTGKGAKVDSVIWQQGRYVGKGIVDFKSGSAVDPSYIDVLAKDVDNIRRMADKQVESGHASALNLFRKKELPKAIEQLQFTTSALPMRTSTVAAFNDLGFFLEQANRASEAITVLERVVAFDPTRTPAYLNLADAYQKAGDKVKAQANYQKYVELMEKAGKGTKIPVRVRSVLKAP